MVKTARAKAMFSWVYQGRQDKDFVCVNKNVEQHVQPNSALSHATFWIFFFSKASDIYWPG